MNGHNGNGSAEPVPRSMPRGADRILPIPARTGFARTRVESFPLAVINADGAMDTALLTVDFAMETYDPRLLSTIAIGFREGGATGGLDVNPFGMDQRFPINFMFVLADFYIRTKEDRLFGANHIWNYSEPATVPIAQWRAPWTYRWADTVGRVVASLNLAGGVGLTGFPIGTFEAIGIWSMAPGAQFDDEREFERVINAGKLIPFRTGAVWSVSGAAP